MKSILSKLTKEKSFYGYPLSWFEPCRHLDAEGWIRNGELYIDQSGNSQPIRMKDKYRKKAGWLIRNKKGE